MNDKTLVERSRPALKQDHAQDCPMRSADCTCGHDDLIWNIARISLDRIEALEAALRRMIYETTHLSPMKPNGDHDCTIKADALEQARQALESQP